VVTQTAYEIPLQSQNQQLTITMGGNVYTLQVSWNDASQAWVLDIGDVNNVPIIQGIPLVTGCDLLGQYEYLGIGGALEVQTDNNSNLMPTFYNLGSTSHLYFVVTD
jgi:hypothetical protein